MAELTFEEVFPKGERDDAARELFERELKDRPARAHETDTERQARGQQISNYVRAVLSVASDTDTSSLDNDANGDDDVAESDDTSGKRPQADVLVELAFGAGTVFFHTPDKEPYATLVVENHREHCPVNAKEFKLELQHLYYQQTGTVPCTQALQSALGVLGGYAVFEGEEHETPTRLAAHAGIIYLDLADADWHTIAIDSGGWHLSRECPVRFRRSRGMRALPVPGRDGSLAPLRALLNLGGGEAGERQWRLLVVWLLAAFRPAGPFPPLVLRGEQGSAKTTTARMLRALLDPNLAGLRPPPKREDDLILAANNGWLVALDNLSKLPPWLSDALCRLATGGGFGTRELYTNDREALFDIKRPVLVNGIDEFATRADFLDRAITLHQPPISEKDRRTEDDVLRKFTEAQPDILGALLDTLVRALQILPTVELKCMPRMADFARFGTAVEQALGWPPGSFMSAYDENRRAHNDLALEDSLIVPHLVALAANGFEGTAGELLKQLGAGADEVTTKQIAWPKSPKGLTDELARLAANLRMTGITIVRWRTKDRKRRRMVTVRRMDGESFRGSASGLSGLSESPDPQGLGRTHSDEGRTQGPRATSADAVVVSDSADGPDARIHQHSVSAEDEVEI